MKKLEELQNEWDNLKNKQENILRLAANEDRLAQYSETEYERNMAKKFSKNFYEEAEKMRLKLMELSREIGKLEKNQ